MSGVESGGHSLQRVLGWIVSIEVLVSKRELVNDLLTPHQIHSHSDTQRTMDSRMVFKRFFYSETSK